LGRRGPFSTPGTLPYNAAVARVAGLPERIDPARLVEREARLCGHLSLARMERLRASLCDGEGTAFIDVCFQSDEQGRDMAVGHVTARLPVRCQRCLEAMEIAIATALCLAFTDADTEAEGEAPPPDGYDAVPLVGDTISLSDLVEDELMLALPMAPMHEDCPVGVWCRYLGDRAPSEAPRKPFAALARIRRPAG
jgi:DUF177 domain-containing protein